jgi:predicted metal-binding transcription factor (methanogenesis marker protein 9)
MSIAMKHILYTIDDSRKVFDIDQLKPFMLTKERKLHFESTLDIEVIKEEIVTKEEVFEPVKVEVRLEKKESYDLFKPTQFDTLFWCVYIIKHGYNDYQQIGRNYGVRELQEKQNISTYMRANISKVKNTNYKVTNVAIQEMLSEMMTIQKTTSILCLLPIIVCYDINILIIDEAKNTMIEFWCNKDDMLERINKTYILLKDKLGKYKVKMEEIENDMVETLHEKHFVFDQYNRPLKSITNYKVPDLEMIIKKLGIVLDEGKKYKKADLYSKIQDYL